MSIYQDLTQEQLKCVRDVILYDMRSGAWWNANALRELKVINEHLNDPFLQEAIEELEETEDLECDKFLAICPKDYDEHSVEILPLNVLKHLTKVVDDSTLVCPVLRAFGKDVFAAEELYCIWSACNDILGDARYEDHYFDEEGKVLDDTDECYEDIIDAYSEAYVYCSFKRDGIGHIENMYERMYPEIQSIREVARVVRNEESDDIDLLFDCKTTQRNLVRAIHNQGSAKWLKF